MHGEDKRGQNIGEKECVDCGVEKRAADYWSIPSGTLLLIFLDWWESKRI